MYYSQHCIFVEYCKPLALSHTRAIHSVRQHYHPTMLPWCVRKVTVLHTKLLVVSLHWLRSPQRSNSSKWTWTKTILSTTHLQGKVVNTITDLIHSHIHVYCSTKERENLYDNFYPKWLSLFTPYSRIILSRLKLTYHMCTVQGTPLPHCTVHHAMGWSTGDNTGDFVFVFFS